MKQTGFFKVPNILFDIKELTTYQKLALCYLFRAGNENAPIFPSYKTIAEKCGMNRSTAIKTVQSLETINVLHVRRRKRGYRNNNSNLYAIDEHVLNEMHIRSRYKPDPGCFDEPGGVCDAPDLVDDTDPIKNQIYKEPDIKNHKVGPTQACAAISFENYIKQNKENKDTGAVELVRYYLDQYKRVLGKEHKNMRPAVWDQALKDICDMYSNQGGETEFLYQGDTAEIEIMMDTYFIKTDQFEQPCDFSLPHFNSPGVKAILYHEQW